MSPHGQSLRNGRSAGQHVFPEERAILRLISEQIAIPLDQLARFFGTYRSDMERYVAEFEQRGWVNTKRFLTGDDVWVWLRHGGDQLAGTGFRSHPVHCRSLPHRRAINEARLEVTGKASSGGHWICESELRRRHWRKRSKGVHIPDAVFELEKDGSVIERYAIEVELSSKSHAQWRKIIAEHSIRYDVVVYLCTPKIARRLNRLKLTSEYPNLIVRELMEVDRRLDRDRRQLDLNRPSRPDYREPTQQEVAILRLLSEQGAIPVDQLARFVNLDLVETEKIIAELESVGCVGHRDRDDPWVWLSSRGARLSGTGYEAMRPAVRRRLTHTRAINEVRLLIARRMPGGRWICERSLQRSHGPNVNLPDAVFLIGEERYAIKVQRTPRTQTARRREVLGHVANYDAVIYFCSDTELQSFKQIKKKLGRSQLMIHELPIGPVPSPRADPRSDDIPILDLIAEQGAIPLDQLARFLKCDLSRAERIVLDFSKEGLIKRARPLQDEPDWIWLTRHGARFSSTGLSGNDPRLGALARIRALNEVRLHLAEHVPNAEWVSTRMLRKRSGPKGPKPAAMLEVGRERHAIEVCLTPAFRKDIEGRIVRRTSEYDTVIFFCVAVGYTKMKRMEASGRWPKLVVRRLPGTSSNRSPANMRKRKPRVGKMLPEGTKTKLVLVESSLEELPSKAHLALRTAHGAVAEVEVLSVERRLGSKGPQCYRVVTDTGSWKVTYSRRCSKVTKLANRFEPGEKRLTLVKHLAAEARRKPAKQARLSAASKREPKPTKMLCRGTKANLVLVAVSSEKLPDEARLALRMAHGDSAEPKVLSVERCVSPGPPRYRVVTDGGIWKLTYCFSSWRARRLMDRFELGERRLERGEPPVAKRRKLQTPRKARPPKRRKLPTVRSTKMISRAPRAKLELVEVLVESLPAEAYRALNAACGNPAELKLLSVERCVSPGPPRYRVVTDVGPWKLTYMRRRWKAMMLLDRFEPGETRLKLGELSFSSNGRKAVKMVASETRAKLVMAEVSPGELNDEARLLLNAAHLNSANPEVLSVERRVKPMGPRCFRVVTDGGVWRVTYSPVGWKVAELRARFEPGETRLGLGECSFAKPRQKKLVMAKIPLAELPEEACMALNASFSNSVGLRVVSAERRVGTGPSWYRVVTNNGVWRIWSGKLGWKVKELANRFEPWEEPLRQRKSAPASVARRQALLSHALEHPGSSYRIPVHASRHGISRHLARKDFMTLLDRGLFTRHFLHKRKAEFKPVLSQIRRLKELEP